LIKRRSYQILADEEMALNLLCQDPETGECRGYIDPETGEVHKLAGAVVPINRPSFRVPPDVIHKNCSKPHSVKLEENLEEEKIKAWCSKRSNISWTGCIGSVPGYTAHDYAKNVLRPKMSPVIMFLLPTIFCLPIITITLGVIEVILHAWAHKKNSRMMDKSVYYQSPLHIITSEICKLCVDENMRNKITKIQDKNTSRFTKYSVEYLRRIVT